MMKNWNILGIILAVLTTAFPVYGQTPKTVGQLDTQNDVIRNETVPGANTRARIADMNKSIYLSSPNLFATYSDPSWITSLAYAKITGAPSPGITNSAINTEAMMSNGTNSVSSGVYFPSSTNINLGNSSTSGTRTISAINSSSNAALTLSAQSTVILSGSTASINNDLASTNTTAGGLTLVRTTSGTPSVGIGNYLGFVTETSNSNNEIGASIEAITKDVTSTQEDFDMVFNTMINGLTASPALTLSSATTARRTFFGTNDASTALMDDDGRAWRLNTTASTRLNINGTGLAIGKSAGTLTPTALLHLSAGSATGNTSTLKFTSGKLMSTPEAGAMEFDGTNLYFTPSGTRYQIDRPLISQLSGGGGTNVAQMGGSNQQWQWNTLGSSDGLTLFSNSTAASSNLATVLRVSATGINSTATQTTHAANFANSHSGSSSTNVALELAATAGVNNYALITAGGSVGIGISNPVSTFQVNGSFGSPVALISSTSTLDDTQNVILVDATSGSIVINLPATAGCNGREYVIKRIDVTSANTVVIDPNGAQLIDGASTQSLTSTNQFYKIKSEGNSWKIIGYGIFDQEIISTVSTYTNYTTTATYQNVASIALTQGEWDISGFLTYSSNGATITAASNAIFVIGTTTASASGTTEGLNVAYIPQAALLGTSKFSESIPPYSVTVGAGSTTYYLNAQATFTLGNPQYVGSIRARRIR